MGKIISHISTSIEGVKKKTKIFKDIWNQRIDYAISQLITARLFYGKPHEGEMGLAIVKFVKETWRSISITRKLDKLCKTGIGKSYIAKLILDNIPKEKRYSLLSEFVKVKDVEGIHFLEGIKEILKNNLTKEEFNKVNNILNTHLSHVITDGEGSLVFDPITSKLYRINEEGLLEEKSLNLKNPDHVLELMSYGIFDKKKDLYSEIAEWRMLKIIEEGELKGLKGRNLGIYVYAMIREELNRDPAFFEAFKYYLAKHIDHLEKSRLTMQAFGDLLVYWAKLQARVAAVAARAMRNIPFTGPLAEPFIALGEAIAGIGDSADREARKRRTPTATESILEDKSKLGLW